MPRIALSLTAWTVLLLGAGCAPQSSAPTGSPALGGESDTEQVRSADVSILFIGNSHTMMHEIPALVCRMIEFRHPEKSVYWHYLPVGFLEDVARNPRFNAEIETRPWKFVVLQAQKISQSGKVDYSRQEGIDYAKLARRHGAQVVFFCEWGLQGIEGDGARQEKIYQEMADATEARVAKIARAWDLALAQRPEMSLHSGDGNHESALGAFLTACVLVGELTGESPARLAGFPYFEGTEADRKFLAEMAAKALAR